MIHLNQDENAMRDVLNQAKTIAVVGHSDKPHRTSYQIAQYLRRAGYTVYAVNPTIETIDGERSYATLADLPEPVDIVNVFRQSEHVSEVVDEAIANHASAIWTQLGVIDEQALQRAREAGLHTAMDRCIKVEHARLGI